MARNAKPMCQRDPSSTVPALPPDRSLHPGDIAFAPAAPVRKRSLAWYCVAVVVSLFRGAG